MIVPADQLYGQLLAEPTPRRRVAARRRHRGPAPAAPLAGPDRRRRRRAARARRGPRARHRLRPRPPRGGAARRRRDRHLARGGVADPRARRVRDAGLRVRPCPRHGHLAHRAAAGRQRRDRRQAGRRAGPRGGAARPRRPRGRRARRPRHRHLRHARAARGARRGQRVVPLGARRRGLRRRCGRGGRARRRLDAARRRPLVRGARAGRDAPGPVPAGVLALAAPGPVADRGDRLDPARPGDDRRRDRLPVARRLPAGPRRQRDRGPHARPAAELLLAVRPGVPVRDQPGAARQRRPDHDPVPAREAVVGDPAAVRVAARHLGRARDRAALDRPARLQRDLPARHGRAQHPVLVRVQVQLRGRALLRRDRVRGLAGAARGGQGPADPARVADRAASRCATRAPSPRARAASRPSPPPRRP